MKVSHLVIAILGGALVPTAVSAQAAPAAASGPTLSAGTVVYDPQGGEVGTIDSVSGANVVLDTGTNKATLPKTAFGNSAKGPTVTVTKTQIDAMVAASTAKSSAALDAALVPGAEVRGKAGTVIGTIKEVTGDQVILDRTTGGPVSLTKQAFSVAPSGLSISMTADELNTAAAAAAS